MVEIFGKPAVAAIIEKVSNGVNYILIQERYKASLLKGELAFRVE